MANTSLFANTFRLDALGWSLIYLVGQVVIIIVARRFTDRSRSDAVIRIHLIALVPTLAFTAGMMVLGGGDIQVDVWHTATQVVLGSLLSISVFALLLLVELRLGWITVPNWGWQEGIAPTQVWQAVLFQIVGHAAVALNEEIVFRGYGLTTLSQGIGLLGAAVVLILLFALFHDRTPRVLIYSACGGVLLTLLRVHTGTIWFGFGYHWMWNVMQTAIFGSPYLLPSLRPRSVSGPVLWVGKPGENDGGIAGITTTLLVIAMVSVWWMVAG